ncbi:hypothetical protein M404DRAFT_131585 [Pisolithus tinctorius Marx 270]|uniref:Uncharacterized protein n=1 Tax=Pisolithus tinctorius Marx 270 TaxID=870435 RepID=A0A0C3PMB5_PISTI|nr:hypothetical protein M404DRAFT_131585 [Pisolithus tinctorius Marx 270]
MLGLRPAGVSLDSERRNIVKTPGRGLVKSRHALQENTFRDLPTTVNAKGKRVVQGTPLQLKVTQTDRVVKDAPGKQAVVSKIKGTPVVRPLGDKTPFPNRTAVRATLISSSSTKTANGSPDESRRASSVRRRVRLPRSASKSFETPVTAGNHWDASDIDIEIGGVVANQSLAEEDYDEVEYMPPKVDGIPYEPPFELPNYREVGNTLIALIRSYPFDDEPPPDPSFTLQELESEDDKLALPIMALEDDMFAELNTETRYPATGNVQSTLPTSRRVHQNSGSRTCTTSKEVRHTSSATRPPVSQKPSSTAAPPIGRVRTAPPIKRPQSARGPISAPGTRASSVSRSAQSTRTGPATSTRLATVKRPATSTTTRSLPLAAPKEPVPKGTVRNPTTAVVRSRSTTVSKPLPKVDPKVVPRSGLLETPKDLEGLIIFEDKWEDEEFLFNV